MRHAACPQVFEEFALAVGEGIDRFHLIRAEARERGDIVGANEDVDGVDLERMQPISQLAEVSDGWLRRPLSESL
jgi:hypothetical protein